MRRVASRTQTERMTIATVSSCDESGQPTELCSIMMLVHELQSAMAQKRQFHCFTPIAREAAARLCCTNPFMSAGIRVVAGVGTVGMSASLAQTAARARDPSNKRDCFSGFCALTSLLPRLEESAPVAAREMNNRSLTLRSGLLRAARFLLSIARHS